MMIKFGLFGKTNVGKSSLVNFFAKKNASIILDLPGITRDVLKVPFTTWEEGQEQEWMVFDTPGVEVSEQGFASFLGVDLNNRDALSKKLQEVVHTQKLDYVFLVVDSTQGSAQIEEAMAEAFHQAGIAYSVLLSKSDVKRVSFRETDLSFWTYDHIFTSSAAHNRGRADILEFLYEKNKTINDSQICPSNGACNVEAEKQEEIDRTQNTDVDNPESWISELVAADDVQTEPLLPKLLFFGKPNVGKSTLINLLAEQKISVVSETAHTTRDVVESEIILQGQRFLMYDSAGVSRKDKSTAAIDKISILRTLAFMEEVDVVVLIVSVEAPMDRQNQRLIQRIYENEKPLIIVVNKIDLYSRAEQKEALADLEYDLHSYNNVFIVPVSAAKNIGIKKLKDTLIQATDNFTNSASLKFSTGKLNRWLEYAVLRHHPPIVKSRETKMNYIVQLSQQPLRFKIFTNRKTEDIPASYIRYLKKSFTEYFELPEGQPLSLRFQKKENPYDPQRVAKEHREQAKQKHSKT